MASHPGHLPQLRIPESIYFVTWRLGDWADRLHPTERSMVASAIEFWHQDRYRLVSYVVMDDHVHVMVLPLPPHELGQILHSWKSYTAKEINKQRNRKGSLWMKDSHTEIMRNAREIHTKAGYIMDNPFSRWPDLRTYKWRRLFDVF